MAVKVRPAAVAQGRLSNSNNGRGIFSLFYCTLPLFSVCFLNACVGFMDIICGREEEAGTDYTLPGLNQKVAYCSQLHARTVMIC